MNARDRQLEALRVPPHSIEAETSVLGSLLLDNRCWDSIGDLLTEGDFYRFEHCLVFGVLGALINSCKPADVITVYERLQAQGKAEEIGGLAYLNALAQVSLSTANVRRYAEIVREKALRRRLVASAEELSAAGLDESIGMTDLMERFSAATNAVLADHGGDDWHELSSDVLSFIDRTQARADGTLADDALGTGLAGLDGLLDGGLRPGQMFVIGARPGAGKTALALRIAAHVAFTKPVAFFSLEMTRSELTERLVAMQGRMPLGSIRRPERLQGDDWTRLADGIEALRDMRLMICDRAGLTLEQLRLRARAAKRRFGVGLITVDYLGLLRPSEPRAMRVHQIEEISSGLKALAKELQCPVLLLSQLNREVEKRINGAPQLSDLRDSGGIEQDADVVGLLHRPIASKPDLGGEWAHFAELRIAKNRHGPQGVVPLHYEAANVRFDDWPAGLARPVMRTSTYARGSDL